MVGGEPQEANPADRPSEAPSPGSGKWLDMAAARDTAEGCQKAVAHRRLVKKPRLKHPAYPGTVLSTQTLATLHKLKASQIELELQNAELRRAHAELAASHARYADLFDLAPVGYLVLNAEGLIQQTNAVAAQLLGVERSQVLGQPMIRFVFQSDRHTYDLHRNQLANSTQLAEACELRLQRPDGSLCWVHVQSALAQDSDRGRVCRVTLNDITQRRLVDQTLVDREPGIRTILATTLDGFWLLDLQGRFLDVNDAYRAMSGYSRGELLQMRVADVEAVETEQDIAAHIALIASQGQERFETRHRCKDGRGMDIDCSVNYLDIDGGRLLCFCRDITERKEAEEALRQSEGRYRAFVEHAPVGICKSNSEDQVVFVNPAFAHIFGYDSPEQFVATANAAGVARTLYWDPDERPRVIQQTLRSGDWQQFETHYRRRDGSEICCLERLAARVESDGKTYLTGFVEDISERKELEAEKDLMVQVLHLLNAENDPDGMLRKVLDLLRRWAGCDAVAIRLRKGDDYPYVETSGLPSVFVRGESSECAGDLTGTLAWDRTGNQMLECLCAQVLRGRLDPAQPFFTPHGSFWTNSTTQMLASTTDADRQAQTGDLCPGQGIESVALIPLRAGGITYGLLQLHDRRQDRFTPRVIALLEQLGESLAIALAQHQAQEALQASEERLRMALAASNQGIFELDLQTGMATVSEGYGHVLGYDAGEFPLSDWLKRVHPDDRAHVERIVRGATAGESEQRSVEYRWKAERGEWRWILACGKIVARDQAGRPLRLLGTYIDISERKRTEEALRLAQKTESLGVLAAGVAHDFNNLLVAMLGQTSLALAKLPPESTARESIEKAVSAAHRATDLTRQLLAYSGRGHFAAQPLSLNVLIEENLRLFEVAMPKHVRLAADLADRLPLIQADAGQIQQVLMNLIINAAEAIGSCPGTVTVSTGVSELTPADRDTLRHTGEALPAGRYVLLQVSHLRPLLHHQVHRAGAGTGGCVGHRERASRGPARGKHSWHRHDVPGGVSHRGTRRNRAGTGAACCIGCNPCPAHTWPGPADRRRRACARSSDRYP